MKSLLKFNNLLCRRENRCSNVLGGSGHRLLSEALEQRRHAPASPDLSSVYINCSISITACVRNLTFILLMWRILCAPNSIPIYISNKMQRYTVYLFLETALHVSGGTSTHHQERIKLYLQHLVFVTPLLTHYLLSAYQLYSVNSMFIIDINTKKAFCTLYSCGNHCWRCLYH
jgi:hypothetical protein